MYQAVRTDLRRLWPQALVATSATVLIPLLAVLSLTWIGVGVPHVVVSVFGFLALAVGVAALGASIWTRRRESVDVPFGELMLWRFISRRRSERRAAKSVTEVDLGPDHKKGKVIRLEEDRSLEVLHRLTLALEATDPYTLGHSRRVERHVHRTAMAMGLSTAEIRELRIAAALHDVGKICIPEQILRKSDALTPEETSIVREHVSVGAMMVAGAAPQAVTEAVLYHHEFWDGHGYPSGLSKDAIPLYARVIAVADAWDAITSARPYKGGEARSRAMGVLRERAGSQFDPELVDAFLEGLPAVLPVTSALLIFLTQHRSTRPVYEWTHSSAFADVSRAAAAAGTAAAVIAIGAIGPQVLTKLGEGRGEASARAAIELVDLTRGDPVGFTGMPASSWEPGLHSKSSDPDSGGGASGALLVSAASGVRSPDIQIDPVSPSAPEGGSPAAATEPPVSEAPTVPVNVESPGSTTTPADELVPTTPTDVTLPSDEPALPGETQPSGSPDPAAPAATEGTQGINAAIADSAPGHDPAGPGNSENAPGHDHELVPIEEAIIADLGAVIPDAPGNSENALGHDPAGPGNSERAPGHAGSVVPIDETVVSDVEAVIPDAPGNSENAPGHVVSVVPLEEPTDLDGAEWISEGEQWIAEP